MPENIDYNISIKSKMKKKNKLRWIFLIWLMLISFFCYLEGVKAEFSLSVVPYEGGYDLRFGKIFQGKVNKEVIVKITSTTLGKRYRLIQVLLEPLTNSEGRRIPQNSFSVYGIRGTNRYGTLLEREIPVSLGRTIIYTSDPQGNSDSFNLVYSLKVTPEQAPGFYRGKIVYILEPIDSAESPVRVILNIFAEVEQQSPKIEIKTLEGRRIYLNPKKKKSVDVLVSIKGNLGKKFQILQLVSGPLINSEGDKLAYDKIKFLTKEVKKGEGVLKPLALSSRKEVIYTSWRGESEDFIIRYNLEELEKEKVGKYRTNIKYFLEIPGSFVRYIDTLPLEVENPPIFNLKVTPETEGVILFKNLKPLQPPKINEVTIEIETNLGKPYQVSQKIISELVNKEGDKIPLKHLSLRTESINTKGSLKYPKDTVVKRGEMVLFVSDSNGSSDKFKVIYKLEAPLNLKPGDYFTRIVYSILEI